MNIKFEKRNVVTMVLGVVIIIGIIFLLFSQVNALKSARLEAAKERDALGKAQTRIKQLQSMEEHAEEVKKELDSYKHLLPQTPEENSLINDVKALANRSGVQLSKINFQERVNKQTYIEMPFKLTFEGRYHNLLNLLQEMRNGPRALRIDDIKISKGQKELPNIKVDITACSFHTPGKS